MGKSPSATKASLAARSRSPLHGSIFTSCRAQHIIQASGHPPKPLYRFTFTTLQTLLDKESKHRLGEEVARAVYEAEETAWDEAETYNRVWVFFDDYRQGDWIVGNWINSIKGLKAEVELERTKAAT